MVLGRVGTLALVLVAGCSYDVAAERAAPPPKLPAGVLPLAPEGAADAELSAVGAVVGNAQVVGLGESTFRTAGFVRSKTQIARWLVEKKGFRAIALETSFGQVEDTIRPFALSCRGSAAVAALAYDDHWRSAEMRDFTQWLCDFNRAHPSDPVEVFGLVQDDTEYEAGVLKSFMAAAGLGEPSFMGTAATTSSCPTPADATLAEGDYAACRGGLESVHSTLEKNAADLKARLGEDRWVRACTAVYALEQWQASVKLWNEKRETESWDVREDGLYEVFKFYRARARGAKTILWAHGYTVSAAHPEVERPRWARTTLGTMLRRDLGAGYKAIGVLGHDVSTRAPDSPEDHSVAPDGSVEAALSRLARPGLVVDLARVDSKLFDPRATQTMGHPKPESVIPLHQLDGLVFIERSPAQTVLGGS